MVDASELDPSVALTRSLHIRNPQDRPSILCVPIGQLEARFSIMCLAVAVVTLAEGPQG